GLTWQESTIDFVKIGPVRYLLTQPLVILYYLRLAVWPSPLVLSYGWGLEEQWPRIVFPGLVILGLLAVMLRGLWRRRWYGFVLAWFFLILAPTSSIAPMRQSLFEHRMYLSLAAVVVLVVIGVAYAVRRSCRAPGRAAVLGGALAIVTVIGLGALTRDRNSDYHDAIGLWQDSLAHRDRSHVAHLNLGSRLQTAGRSVEALRHLQAALALKPDYAETHSNLGNALLALGRPGEAIPHHREALRINPNSAEINYNLGIALEAVGQRREAIDSYREAVRLKPDLADAHYNLGNVLLVLGQSREAISHYREALRLKPDYTPARNNLRIALQQPERSEE
ncbi:MAG: tetratricopeptide repeat protein, partial [Verrucomicrobia bacterium]|nr:tetratricopeptide repeat protein [Verrucomicrobiota bacterium]